MAPFVQWEEMEIHHPSLLMLIGLTKKFVKLQNIITICRWWKIKHTSDYNGLTLLGFVCWVGAHAVVSSLVLSSDVADIEECLRFARGLGSEAGISVGVVPGEAKWRSASLNRAHQGHILPLRDIPNVGDDSQHWF